jgi:hypothetical protein
MSSSNAAAFGALGFSGTATAPPSASSCAGRRPTQPAWASATSIPGTCFIRLTRLRPAARSPGRTSAPISRSARTAR